MQETKKLAGKVLPHHAPSHTMGSLASPTQLNKKDNNFTNHSVFNELISIKHFFKNTDSYSCKCF